MKRITAQLVAALLLFDVSPVLAASNTDENPYISEAAKEAARNGVDRLPDSVPVPGEVKKSNFPLVGLWESVAATKPDGAALDMSSGRAEFEFKPDGTLITTIGAVVDGKEKILRTRFKYTFVPPDLMSYSVEGSDGSVKEQYKFERIGDYFIEHQVDYGTKSVFHRIEKTAFAGKVTDSQAPWHDTQSKP